MDSVNKHLNKSKLARSVAKVLHIRADKFQKTKIWEKVHHEKPVNENHQHQQSKFFKQEEDEKVQERVLMETFVAKLFATISSVKAAYAQLQFAQFPYDAEGIQAADQILVSELKNLSELKRSFLKKHLDDSNPETTQLMAEIQEQKNLLKTYEITRKKLNSQSKLKDSEIMFLKEKLEDTRRENKLIEKRLNLSGSLSSSSSSSRENLRFESLTPTDFVSALKQTTKSIRNLVKFLISEMESANWDLDSAAESIQPDVAYMDPSHKCYAFESFVCREMFEGFNQPEFCSNQDSPAGPGEGKRFFDMFMELKSLKAREYLSWKPNSMFAEFCRSKYLKLVHPKMEFSLFGNLNQRNLIGARKSPETAFFDLFAEVAKRVWLLHCLAFSFGPHEVGIFQVAKGSRFSEVYMEGVNDGSPESLPPVAAFTVVPGFKVGKTVVQCQVYLN